MIWFLVAIIVFIIVGSLIDFSFYNWNKLKQFFTDSWWGMTAIAFALVSLILFYASSKSYKNVKINESFLPNPKRLKSKKENSLMKEDKNQALQEQEIDVSKITMDSLVKKMAYEMTKPGPIFFKGWGNRRLELDVERVHILGDYVNALRTTGSNLMELNAEAVLSYDKIKALTQIKKNNLQEALRESKYKIDLMEERYKSEIEHLKLGVKHTTIELDRKMIEVNEMKYSLAERERELVMKEKMNDVRVKALEAKVHDTSKFNESRSKLLDTIIEEMDMKNINASQAFVLINALAPGATDDLNFQTRAEMVKEELEKMKAQTRKENAEAKEKESKADEVDAQTKFNIHQIKSL